MMRTLEEKTSETELGVIVLEVSVQPMGEDTDQNCKIGRSGKQKKEHYLCCRHSRTQNLFIKIV